MLTACCGMSLLPAGCLLDMEKAAMPPPEFFDASADLEAEEEWVGIDAGPGCGNGAKDDGEECDDGNGVNFDGCNNDCLFSCDGDADCNDSDPCTDDRCVVIPAGKKCIPAFNASPCDDGDTCTSGERCDGHGRCVSDGDCPPECVCFADKDFDSHGDPLSRGCGSPCPAGYVVDDRDCCDRDPFAFSGQDIYYEEPTNCGGWDYNCDGSVEFEREVALVCDAGCSNEWAWGPCDMPPLACGASYDECDCLYDDYAGMCFVMYEGYVGVQRCR
ncbi:MAG: hypothetical protein ABIJ56_19165 [Pseudomonadota bacterium]